MPSYRDLFDRRATPPPQPRPDAPRRAPGASVAWIALVIALAGCFLPRQAGCNLPVPVPTPDDGDGQDQAQPVDPATTAGAWVVVVEESAERSPAAARVLTDASFWADLRDGRGLRWRFYDDDAPEAAPYRQLAESVGLPAVLIIADQPANRGQVLGKFKLPETVEQLSAKIKQITGR